MHACACAYPYLGAQQAGTPIRCEHCRRPVGDDGMARLRVAHDEAKARLEKSAARRAAILAVHALEAREPDPSVEQYVDTVLHSLQAQGGDDA